MRQFLVYGFPITAEISEFYVSEDGEHRVWLRMSESYLVTAPVSALMAVA